MNDHDFWVQANLRAGQLIIERDQLAKQLTAEREARERADMEIENLSRDVERHISIATSLENEREKANGFVLCHCGYRMEITFPLMISATLHETIACPNCGHHLISPALGRSDEV